ncbi:DUF4214 domain-containing protein [Desulfonatronum parangueonense]
MDTSKIGVLSKKMMMNSLIFAILTGILLLGFTATAKGQHFSGCPQNIGFWDLGLSQVDPVQNTTGFVLRFHEGDDLFVGRFFFSTVLRNAASSNDGIFRCITEDVSIPFQIESRFYSTRDNRLVHSETWSGVIEYSVGSRNHVYNQGTKDIRANLLDQGEYLQVVLIDGTEIGRRNFTYADGDGLDVIISLQDGQEFRQGDDLEIVAQVFKGKAEVSGAAVYLRIFSPNGKEYGQQTLVTDALGHAEWRAFFTACASVGDWRIVAQATAEGERAEVSRSVTLSKYNVSPAQVQENITRIIQEWMTNNPGQPNGVDSDPRIKSLWWPKGPKVNLMSWREGYANFNQFTCSSQAMLTLRFLNSFRFSVQKERRLMMAGVDYGPISDGTSLIHVAVAIYPHGTDWVSGFVLEPWYNQKKEAWRATAWAFTFFADPLLDWRIGNPWPGEYPTTGSDGGYYPTGHSELPDILKGSGKTRLLTYSPALPVIIDSSGRRVGRLPNGSVVNEIPGAESSHVNNDDGTFVNFVSVPTGQYEVRIIGTGSGTFHLVAGTDTDLVNYGEQPIRLNEEARFTLVSDDLYQPLRLPDGRLITPRSGLPDSQEISDDRQWIIAFYVAYWNRAADPAGLTYWMDRVSEGVLDIPAVAENFALSAEAKAMYSYFASPFNASDMERLDFVLSVYENLLNRQVPSSDTGAQYWVNELRLGRTSPGAVIGNMIYAAIQADSTDWHTIRNKVQVAEYFAQRFGASGRTWQNSDLDLARQALEKVTSDSATVDMAKARVDQML